MDDLQRSLIQTQCERLSIRFANNVDRGMPEEVARLFSEDGSFSRLGQVLEGPGQVRAFLEKRPATRVTRHVCTNIEVQVISPTEATGVTYFLLYEGNQGSEAQMPLPIMPPATIGEYHDRYVLTPEGWRIQERQGRAVFRQAEIKA